MAIARKIIILRRFTSESDPNLNVTGNLLQEIHKTP